ncbi:hypothetical protein F9802_00835 [Bacillus aerolatus]|uniref:Uncharacterized protein n=1 Tax=Bacillus aerolatus TaxID=2653354 RepID=A0A6I1FJ53_9BACI|nr:hypothetical protein [Bacillus aerolatus]KAB7708729.1 hypothetical protein F9802_00835 [Bacillus aerolatus]
METIIIAILVGLFSLITNRKSGSEKEKKSAPKKNKPSRPASAKSFTQVEQKIKTARPALNEKYEEARKEAGRRERSPGRLSRYQEESVKKEETADSNEFGFEIESDDLARGVIFSEILAPPKALRRK